MSAQKKKLRRIDLSDPRKHKETIEVVVDRVPGEHFLYVSAVPVNREMFAELDKAPEMIAEIVRNTALRQLTTMQEALREARAVS